MIGDREHFGVTTTNANGLWLLVSVGAGRVSRRMIEDQLDDWDQRRRQRQAGLAEVTHTVVCSSSFACGWNEAIHYLILCIRLGLSGLLMRHTRRSHITLGQ